MDDNKPPYFVGDNPPCLIAGGFKSLREKIDLLFQTVESLGQEQHMVLRSAIAHEIDFIEKLMKEELRSMSAPVDATIATKRRRRDFSCSPSSSEVKMQSDHSALTCGLNPGMASSKEQYSKDVLIILQVQKISSGMNEDETKEVARYLLVSNGSAICLLDLKQRKGSKPISNAYDVLPLPKIATLNLVNKKKIPVSVGLFRLGSYAYMIGGHEFPANFRPNCWCTSPNPSGCEKYKALCVSHDLKGTSNATYHFCITKRGTLGEPQILAYR